ILGSRLLAGLERRDELLPRTLLGATHALFHPAGDGLASKARERGVGAVASGPHMEGAVDVVASDLPDLPAVRQVEADVVRGALKRDRALLEEGPMAVAAFTALMEAGDVIEIASEAVLVDALAAALEVSLHGSQGRHGRSREHGDAEARAPLSDGALHCLVV